jgi:signal transduction histidine kinase
MRVVVAHPSDHLEQALAQFLKLSLLSIGAATGILLLAAAWVVRQSLKPLNSLTRQIEGTSLGDTATRFELPAAPSELEPVVDRMNGLMDRVATALEHERQFTSDAAHELRNPVAAIRMQLELALRRPRSIDEYQETIRRVLEVDKHLAVLLDNLLLLARLEAGDERFEPAEIDLAETIDTVWQDFASAAEAKGIGVSKHYREGSRPIRTVHDLLAIALRNLFDNAVDYTPAGGAIEVVTDVEGDRLAITIANTDPGVVPERIGELFRRFRRADPAHDETPQHSGIGLNICSKVAEILNGSITARVVGGMVHFELELPLSPHKPTPSSD